MARGVRMNWESLRMGWARFMPGQVASFVGVASFSLIRPVRERMGTDLGSDLLFWLGWAVLALVLLANPASTWLTTRFRPRIAVALVYRAIELLAVAAAIMMMTSMGATVAFSATFHVTYSVANVLIVALFWAVAVDAYDEAEGATCFATFALSGTLGAVVGSAIATLAARRLGDAWLMVIGCALLESTVWAIAFMPRASAKVESKITGAEEGVDVDAPLEGNPLSGFQRGITSGYLVGLGACVFLFYVSASWVQLNRADRIKAENLSKDERTVLLAKVELYSNVLTVIGEIGVASGMMRVFGPRALLFAGPLVTLAGFTLLFVRPSLSTLLQFQIAQRATEFAFSKPSREQLYTLATREEKYQSKPWLDTLTHRLGDQAGGAIYLLTKSYGIGVFAMMPVILIWIGVIATLGAMYLSRRRAHTPAAAVGHIAA